MLASHPDMPDTEQTHQQLISAQLLDMLGHFLRELHPGRSQFSPIGLDNSLEKELGIDSLARVELLIRIEQGFDVVLSEHAYAAAESPRDLLDLILDSTSQPIERVQAEAFVPQSISDQPLPVHAQTLNEMLRWHCEQTPERNHILLLDEEGKLSPITYAELLQEAQKIAVGLADKGLEPGQTVAIMLPTSRDYFISFYGILIAGGVPVPIYPPARLSQIEDHLSRHAEILRNADTRLLITSQAVIPVARLLQAQVGGLGAVVTAGSLLHDRADHHFIEPDPLDLAFVQYTSGSTGNPKGVKLSHANLLTNIRAMGEAVNVQPTDVFVSWLPLYHDMGLIGAWLGSLYHGIPLIVMSPLSFLTRPHRWLWMIHQHGGTLSAAPNFAYELCANKIEDSMLEGLDLSSWRMAFNGAEPVSAKTIKHFTQRFEKYGFRQETMAPVYGLAESTVGLAFPTPGRGPKIDKVEPSALHKDGIAIPVTEDASDMVEVVACGHPLRGHQIRIVDESGRELPDRRVGHLQFQGPSTTSGYLHNPSANQNLFMNGWLDSGDLAYIADGDIYLTSRVKDIIIRAGRNIYPHELEEAIGGIEGIRKGCVAVFGSQEPESGTERLVIIAETRLSDPSDKRRMEEEIMSISTDLTGTPADEIVLASPHSVLKTSSGKIRRSATRERFEQGLLNQQQRKVWLQFIHLLYSSLKPQWYRLSRATKDHAYAAYAWSLFSLMAPVVWLLVAILPRQQWRWSLIRQSARLIVRLSGNRLLVNGAEQLQADHPMILVANHASYLDGLLLVAGLPNNFRIVAKKEFLTKWVPRVFLQRIGAFFVERFDHKQGLLDLEQLGQSIGPRDALLFFPEGTFARMPGLLPFHMGAFVTAAENDLPVVPIAIRGSRSLLRAGSWFPRRSVISLSVRPALISSGKDWNAQLQLRDRARHEILAWCGEPDLMGETVTTSTSV